MKLFNSNDKQLEAGLRKIEEVLAEREQIKAAIARAEQRIPVLQAEAKSAVSGIFSDLKRLIAGEDPDLSELERIQGSITKAKLKAEGLEAQTAALKQRLNENREELRDALNAISGLRSEWNRKVVSDMAAEYRKAVAVFAVAWRKALAIADAVGSDRACQELGSVRLDDPGNENADPTYLLVGDWREDGKAADLFNALVGARATFERGMAEIGQFNREPGVSRYAQ